MPNSVLVETAIMAKRPIDRTNAELAYLVAEFDTRGITDVDKGVHHIIHWADGGETNLENTRRVCRNDHTRMQRDGTSPPGNP